MKEKKKTVVLTVIKKEIKMFASINTHTHTRQKDVKEIWNGLEEEVVGTRNIHMFKSKLDESKHGHKTT